MVTIMYDIEYNNVQKMEIISTLLMFSGQQHVLKNKNQYFIIKYCMKLE